MSQERHRLVAQVFEAVNARDWDAMGALLDSDFEFHSGFAALEGGMIYRGAQGLRDAIANFDATWQDLAWRIEAIRDTGNRSVVILSVTGVAAGSGVPLAQRLGQVWTWSDVKLVRADGYTEVASALEAVGLSE